MALICLYLACKIEERPDDYINKQVEKLKENPSNNHHHIVHYNNESKPIFFLFLFIKGIGYSFRFENHIHV